MPHYCAYSFTDLFRAANNRMPSAVELGNFANLTQTQRNQVVRQLVEKADWSCKDVKSYESEMFTAFWPKSKTVPRVEHETAG